MDFSRNEYLQSLLNCMRIKYAHKYHFLLSGEPNACENSHHTVLKCDMPKEMQVVAFEVSASLIERLTNGEISSNHAAMCIKKEFDRRYKTGWHCIVGTSFASLVTPDVGRFLYFRINEHRILLWRSV